MLAKLRYISALACVTAIALTSPAAATTAVATGDSLTIGYFARIVNAESWASIASGGTRSPGYVGLEPDINAGGVTHDFTAETLALDPDVIVFLLGTNDAIRPDPWFADTYVPLISQVFDRFEASNAAIVLLTIIPITKPELRDADYRIAALYNPWLPDQARARGFQLLDLWDEIQGIPDWQALYNDGIHLWANHAEGFNWMAGRVEDAVVRAVPEPGSEILDAVACLLLSGIWLRRRARGRAAARAREPSVLVYSGPCPDQARARPRGLAARVGRWHGRHRTE